MFPSLTSGLAISKTLRTVAAQVGLAALVLTAAVVPAHAVNINVVYTDDAGEGFNDPTLGSGRRAAFEAAAQEWGTRLAGTVPVVISASMDPLPISGGGAVLGSAGPYTSFRDFTGAPSPGVWYPSALANQLAGTDLNPGAPDIVARFNSDIDDPTKWSGGAWYYGTDGNNGDNLDYYFVVEHEFGHGLGFLSYIQQDGSYVGGFPIAFDTFKVNGPGSSATLATSMTQTQRAALEVSNSLYFRGTNAVAANGGTNPKLYAPTTYEPGSSGSHLDQTTFQSTAHRMMCPYYSTVTHDPGTVTVGVMKDIGWTSSDNSVPLSINITKPADGVTYTSLTQATGTAAGTDLAKVYLALAKANSSGAATGWYDWSAGTFGTDPSDIKSKLLTGTTSWSQTLPSLANGKYRLVAEADSSDGVTFVQDVNVFTIGAITGKTVSGKCLSIIVDDTFTTPVRKGLAGVTLTLVKNGSTLATTTSAADGTYSFTNVADGTYTVNTSTTRPTQPVTTMDPPSRTFTVNGAAVALDRFALYSIFGVVKGPNSSGTIVPLQGATVTLVNQNNVAVATRTTDVNGRYEFRQQRGATFTLKCAKTGYTFTNVSRTLPTSGNTFSPCARANFTGQKSANLTTGSAKTF